jgi:hypothetical protein
MLKNFRSLKSPLPQRADLAALDQLPGVIYFDGKTITKAYGLPSDQ